MLSQVSFAMLGKPHSSVSLDRFCQLRTLSGSGVGGREKGLFPYFFPFLLWTMSLEPVLSLPLSQLFRWRPPPLSLLLRGHLVPTWALLHESRFWWHGRAPARSCLLQLVIYLGFCNSLLSLFQPPTLCNQFPCLNSLKFQMCFLFPWQNSD